MEKKWIISLLIIILIILFCFRSVHFLTKDVEYSAYENKCKDVYHQTSDRNIIIRIDDIQAYYLNNIQIRMIQDALNMNKTVSLAVIPTGLLNDKELSKFLEENRCKLEIALHGYNNSDYEFANISYKEANNKIKEGLKILNEIEPKVITFIPPNNEISDEGRKAVYANGIKIISSGFENIEAGFTMSTYDWKNKSFTDYEKVLADCNDELNKNETCIIMIHPQDYITDGKLDEEKYSQYTALLNGMNKLNATIVTFRDMYNKGVIKIN
jgi:predicted deacetylase